MAERYVDAGGKRLFLDVRGDAAAPALLYLHGGPGMSCFEFMHWQGDLLSRDLRLIGLDQRGVLRSDAVGDDDPLSEQLLAEDCETIRAELGLESWSVLGHSFGGRIALRYAHQHPERVRAVVFDNPAWDVAATERFRLPRLAERLDRLGQPDQARQARELASRADLFADGYPDGILDLLVAAGPWYLHDEVTVAQMATARTGLPEELEERSEAHGQRLRTSPEFMASLLPLLGELTVPALLLLGESDLVTSPDQAAAFERSVPGGRVQTFAGAGHFTQLEQAAQYAGVITDFVLRTAGRRGSSG